MEWRPLASSGSAYKRAMMRCWWCMGNRILEEKKKLSHLRSLLLLLLCERHLLGRGWPILFHRWPPVTFLLPLYNRPQKGERCARQKKKQKKFFFFLYRWNSLFRGPKLYFLIRHSFPFDINHHYLQGPLVMKQLPNLINLAMARERARERSLNEPYSPDHDVIDTQLFFF